MNLETQLAAILTAKCPRSFPVRAPWGTELPYVTWQRAGGAASRTLNKRPVGNLQNRRISLTVWAASPMSATELLSQIEEALIASASIQCTPESEAADVLDEDAGSDRDIFGMQQNFSIWARR